MKRAVLVVDDDPAVRDSVCATLEAQGFRTLVACHGREALAVLEDEIPGLILVDLEMPVMDGWRLLEAIRYYDDLAKIPTVIMTDSGDVNSPNGRPTPVFQKPFDVAELVGTVRSVLHRTTIAAA